MSGGTHKDDQHFRVVWQINWQIITINLSLLVPLFIKANGLAFVSGPHKITINAATGSNQTFTWKLNISQEHKERKLMAQFGPWNGFYNLVNPIITFRQNLFGNTIVFKSPENVPAFVLGWRYEARLLYRLSTCQYSTWWCWLLWCEVTYWQLSVSPLGFTKLVYSQGWGMKKKNNLIVFLHAPLRRAKKLNYHWFSLLSVPIQLSH